MYQIDLMLKEACPGDRPPFNMVPIALLQVFQQIVKAGSTLMKKLNPSILHL
jgi:hypothetical protein